MAENRHSNDTTYAAEMNNRTRPAGNALVPQPCEPRMLPYPALTISRRALRARLHADGRIFGIPHLTAK